MGCWNLGLPESADLTWSEVVREQDDDAGLPIGVRVHGEEEQGEKGPEHGLVIEYPECRRKFPETLAVAVS